MSDLDQRPNGREGPEETKGTTMTQPATIEDEASRYAAKEVVERGVRDSIVKAVGEIVKGHINMLAATRLGENVPCDPRLEIMYGEELLRQALDQLDQKSDAARAEGQAERERLQKLATNYSERLRDEQENRMGSTSAEPGHVRRLKEIAGNSKPDGVVCPKCSKPLRFYDIGFDDGYKCDHCGGLFEVYDETGRRRDATPEVGRKLDTESAQNSCPNLSKPVLLVQ